MKILITGGSGFIGTNAVDFFLSRGIDVLSIDIKHPQNVKHRKVFKKVDILDKELLAKTFQDFVPTHVLHLAARTDLHEKKNIEGYNVNIKGVENMVSIISQQPTVERCIFTSTKLVCSTDYLPKYDNEYLPNTLYGKSKALGEKIVRNSTIISCDWCIVRPTSIWGPWSMASHIPYGKFFLMIAKKRYFHPGRINPPKSFGYVGNTVFQIQKLFDAPREQIHQKVFYLSDYEPYTIKDWADLISLKLHSKKVQTLPEFIVHLLALGGDFLKFCGIKEPSFSSFRLYNMRADTSKINLEPVKQITGPLPYTIEEGVEETLEWLKNMF